MCDFVNIGFVFDVEDFVQFIYGFVFFFQGQDQFCDLCCDLFCFVGLDFVNFDMILCFVFGVLVWDMIRMIGIDVGSLFLMMGIIVIQFVNFNVLK